MDSNLVKDIVNDVHIKPSRTKVVLRWVVTASLMLIAAAFIVGQFKTSYVNKIKILEEQIRKNQEAYDKLHQEMHVYINETNQKIDKIYVDAYEFFSEFNRFRNDQIKLILDNSTIPNKEMLKRMLDLNTRENMRKLEMEFNSEHPVEESPEKSEKHLK
jgi:archaellum component FlaF (FlaF/FlaG flagellin family)